MTKRARNTTRTHADCLAAGHVLTLVGIHSWVCDSDGAVFPVTADDLARIAAAAHPKDRARIAAAATTTYAAQWRRGTHAAWVTVGMGHTAAHAAAALTDDMAGAGFRLSEIVAHRADLAAGHVLTSEHGLGFRVVATPARCAEHPAYEADYCPVCGTAVVVGGTR